MKFWDTIYFKWITASVVFIALALGFIALWQGLMDGKTFGDIVGGAFTLQGSRTISTKALDFGYKYLDSVKTSIANENNHLDDDALARRADDVANSGAN